MMTIAINSYRTGNQIRLPKQRLYMGHATVGIQVKRSMNAMTPTHIDAFHFPRGANRSYLKARIAISIPKTRVTYPVMKIATHCQRRTKCLSPLQNLPGRVIIASPRQLLDNTLRRDVLCTATKITCCITAPQASTSGKVSAGWTVWRKLKRLASVSIITLNWSSALLTSFSVAPGFQLPSSHPR